MHLEWCHGRVSWRKGGTVWQWRLQGWEASLAVCSGKDALPHTSQVSSVLALYSPFTFLLPIFRGPASLILKSPCSTQEGEGEIFLSIPNWSKFFPHKLDYTWQLLYQFWHAVMGILWVKQLLGGQNWVRNQHICHSFYKKMVFQFQITAQSLNWRKLEDNFLQICPSEFRIRGMNTKILMSSLTKVWGLIFPKTSPEPWEIGSVYLSF